MRLPFAAEGLMFIIPLAVVSAGLFIFGWPRTGMFFAALLLFVLFFFRDPERTIPAGDDLIISPADGKVVKIDTAYQSPDHPNGSVCISIFLSVFNVHIQRSPVAGKVTRKFYNKGKFMAAWDHKASLDNEQTLMVIESKSGVIGVKQIAGLIARRIVNWTHVGAELQKGERFGLIRFGSRVDLIMPAGTEVVSKIGDTVAGGETVMAKFTAAK